MLGHADIRQTPRYLNITDEELRKARSIEKWRARQDSNLRPLAPEANALSS
jgi:hypothetical protein